jgi:two-component system sensor histidine kinase HydH
MRVSARFARWGLLATTFALGAALLGTAWAGRRAAARASDALVRGQSDVLMEALREYLRARPGWPALAALDSFVTDRADAGVRYVGLRLPGPDSLIEAGAALGGPPAREGGGRRGPPPEPRFVAGRVRMSAPIPVCAEPPCAGREGLVPASVALEIEPVVAEALAAGARRTFWAAAGVTGALLAAALMFWRLSLLREREQQQLERNRRLASLGEMSAVLAHEIRNPLASLKGNAQLLAERLDTHDSGHRKAERIVAEAKRLESLITDLLDFARAGTVERAPTDPTALLRAAVEEAGADAFDVHSAAVPPWPLDAGLMTRALTNILRNARQASPEGMRAEVELSTRNGTLAFRIRDHGPGIPAGEEARIFEPFFTTRTTGTGLGLAVARRIAELHDGTVTASNHPDGGAVFEILIPKE